MQQQRARGAPDNEQTRALMRDELDQPRGASAQEAQRTGVAKKPEVQAQIDIARQEIMVGAYLRDWVRKHPVTDADVQKEYERAKAQSRRQGIPRAPHPGRDRGPGEEPDRAS